MDDSRTLQKIEKQLAAILALLAFGVFDSHEEKIQGKPEVLLSNAGLENSDIAKILGKKLGAVQKTLQRSKK